MKTSRVVMPRPTRETPHDVIVYPKGLGWARFSPEQADLPGGDFEICTADGRRFIGSWAIVGVEVEPDKFVTELRLRGFAAHRLNGPQYRSIVACTQGKLKFDRSEGRP